MGFFDKIKTAFSNMAAASRERAAAREAEEAERARQANEHNEREKGYGRRERADEYWAIIDRSTGLSGEIPDINFSKVYSAINDEDLENKLSEFIDKEARDTKRFMSQMPKKSTYFEIKERYPNKEIFRVDSEVLQEMLELPDDEFHKRRRRGGGGGGAHRNGGGSRGGRGRQDFTHQRELQPSGYYAIIEDKMGSFYGEIPGFTMLRAVACDSYDKCVEDLTEQLTQKLQFTAPAMWPAKKNYDEIQKLCGITRTVVQIVAKL